MGLGINRVLSWPTQQQAQHFHPQTSAPPCYGTQGQGHPAWASATTPTRTGPSAPTPTRTGCPPPPCRGTRGQGRPTWASCWLSRRFCSPSSLRARARSRPLSCCSERCSPSWALRASTSLSSSTALASHSAPRAARPRPLPRARAGQADLHPAHRAAPTPHASHPLPSCQALRTGPRGCLRDYAQRGAPRHTHGGGRAGGGKPSQSPGV